jgi:hypothetical protein
MGARLELRNEGAENDSAAFASDLRPWNVTQIPIAFAPFIC